MQPRNGPAPAVSPAPAAARAPAAGPLIAAGHCHLLFAYDIGLSIRLEEASRLVAEVPERETIRHKRRTPTYFEYRPTPLRITQSGPGLTLGGFRTIDRVECVIYDFGAVSLSYAIPLAGPLSGLLPLADLLYENKDLLEDSRRRVDRLLERIRPAVDKPHIADLEEDYAIYQIEALDPAADAVDLLRTHRQTLAQILRAEPQLLSEQEVEDALTHRISYTPADAAVIDWNAAVLFQGDSEDVRAVLEYANVELLELRRLDDQLDHVLDRSYEAVGRRDWRSALRLVPGREMRRIARMQMDSALLFEGVNNALKLVGDQYLARLYTMAAARLHLKEWDASILRKLQTAESIYQKLSDQAATRRLEVLEWIIILLIAVSVAISFW
ncbi:MAG: hypothetical protein WD749_14405 [Phycisphaerales bacterium]